MVRARRTGSEKRGNARLRTRLRSGKIAGRDGQFLADCLIYDRSSEGARLRLEGARAIPERILLFDDELGTLFAARVAWRSQLELGIRYEREREVADRT